MAVVIETTIGDFTVDLYTKERPQTCRNFLKLCKIKYYNWSLFFTVQSNFIAQTGDPTATGKGGESVYGIVLGEKARYYEAEQIPKIKHDKAGLISMVNCGNNMLGSQFFITLASELQSLDGEHCVFGEITEGIDIILKFNEIICDVDHRPYQDVRISHTVVLEDPYDDPQGLVIPDASPGPTKEMLTSERIAADETIDDTEGMTVEEIVEMQKEKEAKARATILEIVGDIPDAEMAPPENVLFVCKLNPVTNDDDLEIIFSRFGKIVGCEVIRDKQSGDSLQYAFIEFAERKSCEDAYFKMDNVLIDDRRIHVDFSQSVAKMRWRGKGKGIKYFDQEDEEKKDKEKSKDIKKHRSQTNRDRSESPRKGRNKYDSKKDSRRKQECSKNGDDRKRDSRRDDRDCKLDRKTRDKSQNRSRSNEKSRSKEKVRERSRDRRGKSKDKRDRSSERSRDRSRERSRDRRDKSRDRSRERRDKKDRNDYECRNRSDRDSRNKDEKKKKKHKRHSSEEDDRHLSKRKQRKSRDRSEERHEKSSQKHKHKHKSR